MPHNDLLLETIDITKIYGGRTVVDHVRFGVGKAEIVGLLGPNGAGKTTTIRLLLAMLKPTRGKGTVFGFDCWKDTVKIKEEVGYVPGDVHLYENMTGARLVEYITHFRPRQSHEQKQSLVKRLDLDLSRRVKELSKGNKQKLAIVLALMHEPRLLILDEPTIGLDPLIQQEVYQILKDFQARGGTIFLSSHFLPEVERICDRVGIVKDGFLVAFENVGTLAEKHIRHVEVAFDEEVRAEQLRVPQVSEVREFDGFYELTVVGEIDPVIKLLSRFKIRDIVFTHATLEEVFLEYYR